jgi:DnaA-homolog protein
MMVQLQKMNKQLALDLQLREFYTFDYFVAGDNALVIDLLKLMASRRGEQQLFIWGEHFTGKSHLLQAVCQLATDNELAVTYLPFNQVINYSADMLDGLENIDVVCIDDIQLVAGKDNWQEKVFDLINRMREANKFLLFSSDLPPNEMKLNLEDLRSRLNWGPVMRINPLNDQQKQQALQLRAKMRGFELSEQVSSYILKNYSRDMPVLFEKLEQLDHESLAQQRRLTIPFVKAVFEES